MSEQVKVKNTHLPECSDCVRCYEKWCSYFEAKQTCDYRQYLQRRREPFVDRPNAGVRSPGAGPEYTPRSCPPSLVLCERLLVTIDAVYDCVQTHGTNGLSSIDNLRRVAQDLKSALAISTPNDPNDHWTINQIRQAFRETFHKEGELFFDYLSDEETCETSTEHPWLEFVGNLLITKMDTPIEKNQRKR